MPNNRYSEGSNAIINKMKNMLGEVINNAFKFVYIFYAFMNKALAIYILSMRAESTLAVGIPCARHYSIIIRV